MTWKKKDTRPAFPSVSLPVENGGEWKAPCIILPSLALFISRRPSLTLTILRPPFSGCRTIFLKLPHISSSSSSSYANAKQEHNGEATEGNQHHHFSDRKRVMSLRSQRVLDREAGVLFGDLLHVSITDLREKGRGRNIRCLKMTTFSIPSKLQELWIKTFFVFSFLLFAEPGTGCNKRVLP